MEHIINQIPIPHSDVSSFIQAIASILTLIIAFLALKTWKSQKDYEIYVEARSKSHAIYHTVTNGISNYLQIYNGTATSQLNVVETVQKLKDSRDATVAALMEKDFFSIHTKTRELTIFSRKYRKVKRFYSKNVKAINFLHNEIADIHYKYVSDIIDRDQVFDRLLTLIATVKTTFGTVSEQRNLIEK